MKEDKRVSNKKKCIAMLQAGGKGSRLLALTKHVAKPPVSFGGKYRIIDVPLSNCANSHIDTVGVLTQYRPYELNTYIGNGAAWDLDGRTGGIAILPPYATQTGGQWYAGTADAIYQNLEYINIYDPEYVLILSGDQLYKMDYRKMLKCHTDHNADLTVAVMRVPIEDASRFGIMSTDEEGRITKFAEKPKQPESNLASMGIYIFSKKVLEDALIADAATDSEHDFGGNIIPNLLAEGKRVFSYEFSGYWRDVGTIASYHEASMEFLDDEPEFDLCEENFAIMSRTHASPPHYVGAEGDVQNSFVASGTCIFGTVHHSIVSTNCYVGAGAYVKDAVLLPGARVEDGARVVRAILGEKSVIPAGTTIGSDNPEDDIVVTGDEFLAGGNK